MNEIMLLKKKAAKALRGVKLGNDRKANAIKARAALDEYHNTLRQLNAISAEEFVEVAENNRDRANNLLRISQEG